MVKMINKHYNMTYISKKQKLMNKLIRNSTVEFLIFTSLNGEDSIEVKTFEDSICRKFRHTKRGNND
ncbi:MAG: hypothetical protein KAJ49_08240 [Arcobacteraceae bacterium]|nr:hypothetical protein [Arcobacteraceae bacterium]